MKFYTFITSLFCATITVCSGFAMVFIDGEWIAGTLLILVGFICLALNLTEGILSLIERKKKSKKAK